MSEDEDVKAQFTTVRIEPKVVSKGKSHQWLANTDIASVAVQVIAAGGENNLHHHPNTDQFWLILQGRLAFYGDGDTLVAELGPQEGILVPRGVRYWFESRGEEPCTIVRFASTMRGSKDERLDDSEYRLSQLEEGVYVAAGSGLS